MEAYETNDGDEHAVADDRDGISSSEEERMLEECEQYEHEYNFRFEEPDQNFVSFGRKFHIDRGVTLNMEWVSSKL